eukprot:TRINITY_DN7884_c0_g1_i5.p1 TRINITY_DN7884_c0_g1~~TRINITY_DN7884_c0_g1_i5.p1  ORF type:complete len:311 (+),score=57.10 TRINITY_DN7884_c0_g1_i5:362-1294(+)
MGPRPPEEVLQKFLDSLRRTINGSPYAEIRLREFEKYYDRISANIDSDEFFNEMLERAWNLPPGWMGAASAASRRVGNRGSRESGKQILSRLRAALTRKKLSFDDDRLAEVVRSGSSRFRDVVRGAMNRGLAGSDAARNADTLARALQEYWPELSDKDVRILGAIFQTDDGDFDMEYFAEELGLSAADRSSSRADARREAILRVYQDLTGSAEELLDFRRLQRVPPVFRRAFGDDACIALSQFLQMCSLLGAGETQDAVFEKALRHAWGLSNSKGEGSGFGSSSRLEGPRGSAFTSKAKYYKGMSSFQLG